MEQIVMKVFNLFIAPLLVLFLPLQMALITLGVFFIINLFVHMLLSIRKRKIPYWRVDRYIDDELITYALQTVTSYTITILAVSLFEVHVLGIQSIEIAGQLVSLTRAVVILATAQQLGRVMQTTEELTGFRLFNVLLKFTPNWLKDMFNHKNIYEKTDDENNDFTEPNMDMNEPSIKDEEKTS